VLFIYLVTASTIVTAEVCKSEAISICSQTQYEHIAHETAICRNPPTHKFTADTKKT
jgi:hypothetical protein